MKKTVLVQSLAAVLGLAAPPLLAAPTPSPSPTPAARPAVTSAPTPHPTLDDAVWTQHNNNFRTGVFPDEKELNPRTVKTIRRVARFKVNGAIYAQPLYLPADAARPGRNRKLVIVASTDDCVSAFDADAKGDTRPAWTADLLGWINQKAAAQNGVTVAQTVTNGGDFKCEAYSGGAKVSFLAGDLGSFAKNIGTNGDIGILGTPVLDQERGILYVVTRTSDDTPGPYTPRKKYYQWLWALDVDNGGRPVSWAHNPLLIPPALNTGDHQSDFDPAWQNQRAALALSPDKKRVYVAWAGECDTDYYHGWVMGFDCATDLSLAARFNVTPECGLRGEGGGIWQAGQGPVVDANGSLYFATGNGDFNVYDNGRDYGDSIIKLGRDLNLQDYFTPSNQSQLDISDYDLGSAGLLMIPRDPPQDNLILGAGKEAKYFLLKSSNLGGYDCRGNDGVFAQTRTRNGAVTTAYVTVGGAYQAAFVTIGAILNHYGTPGELPQDGNGCVNTNHVHGGSIYWEARPTDPSGNTVTVRKVFVMPENDVARAYCLEDDDKFDLGGPVTYLRPVTVVVPRVLYSGSRPAAILPGFFGFNLSGQKIARGAGRKKGEGVYRVAHPSEIGYCNPNNPRDPANRKGIGMPGGMLSLSCDGDDPESGVLWVSYPDQDAYIVSNTHQPNGILVAYQALDPEDGTAAARTGTKPLKELWCSKNSAANQVGHYAKYVPPTVANGRVYLATFDNCVVVYGNH